MRVICAWCQREGRSWLLRIGEPIDDPSETHGICDRHQQAMLEMFPSRSFPSTRWLLIVSPGEPAAYSHLTTVMRGVEGVTVIVDRRSADRRRGGDRPAIERRQGDRRVRRPERSRLGYMLVRFAPRGFGTEPETASSAPSESEDVDPGEPLLRV